MVEAVDFSFEHVKAGGLPFVGVLVAGDGYVSESGVNEVALTGDSEAHAEIVAMRAAMRHRGRADLAGTWLLATGEPCGMCCRFALDHHVERFYVAVDSDTVADHGFDYRASYAAFGVDRSQLTEVTHRLAVPRGLEPFEQYLALRHDGRRATRFPPSNPKGTP